MVSKYKAIKVNGIKHDEHRYVMERHLGQKLSFDEVVHHKDENPRNNDISNLEVLTRQQHIRIHQRGQSLTTKHKDKLSVSGRKFRTAAKLSIGQVKQVRNLLDLGVSIKNIAEIFCVSYWTIRRIHIGETWSWVG